MSGEKQNRIGLKLQSLSDVPDGMTFRQELCWEKMEHRLGKKMTGIRSTWYRVAAALLVICGGAAFLYGTHSEKPAPAPGLVQAPMPAQKLQRISINVTDSDKAPAGHTVIKVLQPAAVPDQRNSRGQMVPDTSADIFSPPALTAAIEQADTTKALVVQPKYRIAHINEIYSAEPQKAEEPKRTFPLFRKNTSLMVYDEPVPLNDGLQNKQRRSIFPHHTPQ